MPQALKNTLHVLVLGVLQSPPHASSSYKIQMPNFNKEMCFYITCFRLHGLAWKPFKSFSVEGLYNFARPLLSLNFNLGCNTAFVQFVQISLENIRIYFEYSSDHISHETAIR